MRRSPLSLLFAAGAVLAGLTLPRAAQGQVPADDALDFAPLDLATLSAAGGAAWAFDKMASSIDLRGALTVATMQSLGLGVRALHFEALGRPGVHTTALSGWLIELDQWMIGQSTADASRCLAWVSPNACANDSGFFGFGASFVGVHYDTQTTRTAMRVGELDAILSPTPAYASAWKKRRLLVRTGASADYFWQAPGLSDQWVARLALGLDALLLQGRHEVRAFVRWRPNLGRFVDDFGIESGLSWVVLWQGPGWVQSGQRYQAGLDVGYAYWKVPALAYGPDWLLQAQHTMFARLVFSAALASLTPPSM